jgi:hypothetical protein
MKTVISTLFAFLSTLFRSRVVLHYLSANYTASPHSPGRPPVLVLVFALLVRLAERTGVCSAQDRDRLAAQALSGSLGQIEQAGQTG